jgi:hypothetical protein
LAVLNLKSTKGSTMIKRLTLATAALASAAVMGFSGVAVAAHHPARHAVRAHATETVGPDTDSVQSGDQTTPDTASASASEASGEETVNDGPGGHEDEAGAEADHQFEGEE